MLNIIRWQKNCENLIQGYLKNTVESPKINLMFGTQHKYIYAWKKFYKNLSLIPSKYGYEIKFQHDIIRKENMPVCSKKYGHSMVL